MLRESIVLLGMFVVYLLLLPAAIAGQHVKKQQQVELSQLYTFLEAASLDKKVRGSDLAQWPKLSAIVGSPNDKHVVSRKKVQQALLEYIVVVDQYWRVLDFNGDGFLTRSEVTARLPQLVPYIHLLDTNNDGLITRSELLNSQIVFPMNRNQKKSAVLDDSGDEEISDDPSMTDQSLADQTVQHKVLTEDDPQKVELVVVTGSNFDPDSGITFASTGGPNLIMMETIDVDSWNWPKPVNLCKAAMVTLAAIGCAAINAACLGTSVLTFGAIAIPCAVAIPIYCVAVTGMSSLNADEYCVSTYGP